MILVVNVCAQELHFFEFVKPVLGILRNAGIGHEARHYADLTKKDLSSADKIIICGTSLKDFRYSECLQKFSFLNSFEKPVLGICAGAQIIALVNGCSMEKNREIGLQKILFAKKFLGVSGSTEVYGLHNACIVKNNLFLESFEAFSESGKCVQAFRHRKKPFFGVLFHPEVRNKKMVLEFANL
ncbi:MAG: hypothetical protein AABW99_02730 [archaeon]